jgi:hypothetical protein
MTDISNEKLQRVAKRMRDVFFDEFCHPNKMSSDDMDFAIRALIGVHAGEVIEAAARFKSPTSSVRDTCIAFIDAMIAENEDQIAETIGKRDPRDFLLSCQLSH